MKLSNALSFAFALQMISMSAAEAASLRTAPFAGDETTHGFARCAITNASSASGNASATLYDFSGEVLETLTAFNVRPHSTMSTESVVLLDKAVGHCECTVPNATTWRCTVLWTSSDRTIGTSTTTP